VSEPADVVVRALGLVKRFNARTVVDQVDVVVRSGERVALLGPNGAGKTTTLLMLLGVVTPDEGTIESRRLCASRAAVAGGGAGRVRSGIPALG